jgi:hypothetical protein
VGEEDGVKAHIGDVVVHHGEPPNSNPYHGNGLMGPERRAALAAFKRGENGEHTFWYAPCGGGARRITKEEVNWKTSGV